MKNKQNKPFLQKIFLIFVFTLHILFRLISDSEYFEIDLQFFSI